jgi:hypothetical protein
MEYILQQTEIMIIPDNLKGDIEKLVNWIEEYDPTYYITHDLVVHSEYCKHHANLFDTISNLIKNLIISDHIKPTELLAELSFRVDLSKFENNISRKNDLNTWFIGFFDEPNYNYPSVIKSEVEKYEDYYKDIAGMIKLCPISFNSKYYITCDGRTLDVKNYELLFTLIGFTFGGDNQLLFKIPNMKAPSGFKYVICVDGQYPESN